MPETPQILEQLQKDKAAREAEEADAKSSSSEEDEAVQGLMQMGQQPDGDVKKKAKKAVLRAQLDAARRLLNNIQSALDMDE